MNREEIAQRFSLYKELLGTQEWEEMISAFSRPLPATFWTHPMRVNAQWIVNRFTADHHSIKALPYAPGGYGTVQPMKWGRRFEFRTGLLHLQEAASMLPPIALDPKPGELVLDLCAAPGGKSAQLSLMMKNQGTLVVNDLSFARLRALRATQERLGLKNIVLCAQEGQKLLKDHPPCFDKVLVDAPCSCEGTLRKRGKWTYEPDEGDFKKHLITTQKALLLQALKLTKLGGRVVYSTCTLDPQENEGVIADVLDSWSHLKSSGLVHGDLELEPLKFSGLLSSPGLTSWAGQKWSQELKNALRVYPQQNDSGGFFLASLKVVNTHRETKRLSSDTLSHWKRPILCDKSQKQMIQTWADHTFGLAESTWSTIHFTKPNSRCISTVNQDLILPPTSYQVAGLPSFYVRGAVPRLTTAAVLEWGGNAQRSVIDIQTEQEVDLYYAGLDQVLSLERYGHLSLHQGTYILRYQSYPLGLAYLKKDGGSENSSKNFVLASEYPKRLRLVFGRSAFETPKEAQRK